MAARRASLTAADIERFGQVVLELAERLGGAVRDFIPPEAQTHINNAQKELLTALLITYQHQMRQSAAATRARARTSPASAEPPAPATARRPRRVIKID